MDREHSARRLRRWSRVVSWILALSAAFVAAFYVFEIIFSFVDPAYLASIWSKQDPSSPDFSPEAMRWYVVVHTPMTLIYIFSALAAWNAFDLIAEQSGISRTESVWLRRAGLGFAVTAVIGPFTDLIHLGVLVYAHAELPDKNVTVSFGTPELMTLLVSFMMFVLAHVMTLAADIDRDNKLIV